MRPYIEPFRLAFLKNVLLESVNKRNANTRFTIRDFLGHSGCEEESLAHLIELHHQGLSTIKNIIYPKEIIEIEQEKVRSYNKFLSLSYSRSSAQKFKNNLGLPVEIFRKIRNKQELTLEELLKINAKLGEKFFEYSFSFDMEFKKNGTRQIRNELKEYIQAFIQGELVEGMKRYYSYSVQQLSFERTISSLAQMYGPSNLPISQDDLYPWIIKSTPTYRNAIYQTRFLETLFAMEQEGLIGIVDVLNEKAIRITMLPPKMAPAVTNEWNRDFYEIGSSLAFFNFIKKKKETADRLKAQQSTDTELKWNDLSLNTKTGWANLGNKRHKFKLSLPPFKVLKQLLEANGEIVTYEQFFKAVVPSAASDPKAGKEFIRQKIRDIRKGFGLNRLKDREKDIFNDTGDGFQLLKLAETPETITE